VNEFIEIYNKGPDEIDLENWQLDDEKNKGSRPYTFTENSKIRAGEWLAIPYAKTKIALNNNGDWARLLWPNEQAIDEIEYEEAPQGKSYSKIYPDWCWSNKPTPGEQNICSTENAKKEAKSYPRSLWINEFLPDPEGKDVEGEFIELQNRGSEEIDLSGWQLDDLEDGGSRLYTFPEGTKLPVNPCLVVYYQDSKIALNNKGDWVRLLNPAGQAIDEIEYSKAPKGKSYSRQTVTSWQWTENPSPGKDNEFPQVLPASQGQFSPSLALPQTGPGLRIYLSLIFLFCLTFLVCKYKIKINT